MLGSGLPFLDASSVLRAVTLAALLALSAPAHAEFTCEQVLWWSARFSQAQLEAMATSFGYQVTDTDRKRASKCFPSKERK